MKVLTYEYTGEGMHRVFETAEWTVGIKNWKPASDPMGIDCLERHNLTDELFVLLEGKCDLLFANEADGALSIRYSFFHLLSHIIVNPTKNAKLFLNPLLNRRALWVIIHKSAHHASRAGAQFMLEKG